MKRVQKNIQVTFIFFLFVFSAQAQKIDGKVTNSQGSPIESVSIIVKSSGVGTTSNSNGEFSIAAKKGDVLSFTSTGYKIQQVTIQNMSSLSVVMISEITQLEQIVLLGSRGSGSRLTSSI